MRGDCWCCGILRGSSHRGWCWATDPFLDGQGKRSSEQKERREHVQKPSREKAGSSAQDSPRLAIVGDRDQGSESEHLAEKEEARETDEDSPRPPLGIMRSDLNMRGADKRSERSGLKL